MKEKPHPDMSFEMEARASGFLCVAGVDEAGRGPLAGPVVAGAVILPVLAEELTGLNDSKQLTAAKRERLFLALLECEQAVCSVGVASVEEIDRFNILRATHLAMARAVEGLALRADFCLVDGLPVKGLPVPHRAIVKGDGRSLSIAAASVLAKVTRDRMMMEADASYPQYGLQNTRDMAQKPTWKLCGGMGPVRSIAARLRRFHKWNCPSLSRGKRDTAWLGMYGELAAASFLRAEGCVILRRNWRPVRGGELDIVCREGECLVFVEVKTVRGMVMEVPAAL